MSVMYAIAFDLDTQMLTKTYHNESYNNAYADIEKTLIQHGFSKQQGSMYFGNTDSTAVDCTLAIMDLTSTYDWFAPSVKDVRMLRVEDNNDLKPIIEKTANIKSK